MGKNAKKEKVYGDANVILPTAAAEQATHRSGTKELTRKQTWPSTVRCVQGQNFIHTGQKAEERTGSWQRRENKSLPYRWIHLWEVKPQIPGKTTNLSESRAQPQTQTLVGHGNKIQYHNS